MKHAYILLVALMAGPAAPFERDGNTITFSDEEVSDCKDQGGCVMITRDRLKQLVLLGCWTPT